MRLGLLMIPILCGTAAAQPLSPGGSKGYTRADTLRGSIGPERAWWDATHYDVVVRPDFLMRTIEGTTTISFKALSAGQRMQIDLQQPLEVKRASYGFQTIGTEREGDVLWVDLPDTMEAGAKGQVVIHYAGKPRAARTPPWDGGWIWKTDERGNPWMSQ